MSPRTLPTPRPRGKRHPVSENSLSPSGTKAPSSGSRCYWSITRSGTNYGDIVENDVGAIGVLTVSLGDGQDFQSRGCGDWAKIG